MRLPKIIPLALESLGVLLCSLLSGALGGFILGTFTLGFALSWFLHPNIETATTPLMLGVAGAWYGAVVIVIVGPLLYFTLLRGRLTWRRFAVGFLLCVVTNLPLAIIGAGFLCAIGIPYVALVVSLIIRFRLPELCPQRTPNVGQVSPQLLA